MSISSSVEQLDGLHRRLTITIAAEKVREVYDKQLKQVSSSAKVDGFRPGKIPQKVIEKRFGARIHVDVARELFDTYFSQALIAEKLAPAGQPEVDTDQVDNFSPDKPLSFSVKLEVYPEISLADMSAVKIERKVLALEEADIDTALERLRKQQATWQAVERAAVTDDQLTIDFEGFMDGEPFEHNSAKDFTLELGANQMIPGFEDGLLGTKAGETCEVSCTFPEDYHAEKMRGKLVVFKITVHQVAEASLPEIDDDFVNKLSVEGGVAGLRKVLEESMMQHAGQALKQQLKEKVMDKLKELNTVALPEALVKREIIFLREKATKRAERSGEAVSEESLSDQQLEANARERVTLGLLLGEIIKTHKLEVNPQMVRERVEQIVAAYHQPERMVNWYYEDKDRIAEVEAAVLEEQAVDKLLETMQVEEKTIRYDEVAKAN